MSRKNSQSGEAKEGTGKKTEIETAKQLTEPEDEFESFLHVDRLGIERWL